MRDFVADAGPLISFERIPGGFDLLRRLARTIIIPEQVHEELTAGLPPGRNYLVQYGLAGLVEVRRASDPLPGTGDLDVGERYAIALAAACGLPLLIEERRGRAVAERLGLASIGAVGLLLDGLLSGVLGRDETERHVRALFDGKRINRDLRDALVERIRLH